MPSADEPVRALRRLLESDPDFAAEPRRLGRGLLDLLPHDDRAVRLLTLAAELAVPGLVDGGRLADARRALIDRAGLHPEAADWVVEVWRAAATGNSTRGIGAVRLAAGPDGTLLVVSRDSRGVFAAAVGPDGPVPWRLLAHAAGPGRLAVAVDGERVVIAWSQPGGVYAAEVRPRNGTFTADPPEAVTEIRAGLTPDAPVAVVAVDETLHHLVWPAPGGRLRRGSWRAWPSDEPEEDLPVVGGPVTALDAGRATPDAALLAVSTALGGVRTARWDLAGEVVGSWRDVALPGAAYAIAVAGPRVLAELADGRVVDDKGAVVRPATGERLVAAAAVRDTAWLASAAADTITLSRPGTTATWSLPAP